MAKALLSKRFQVNRIESSIDHACHLHDETPLGQILHLSNEDHNSPCQ